MNYKVNVFAGEKKIELRELPLREPKSDEVLIKVSACALCTLEQRIWLGIMKYYPYAGGHEFSGVVQKVGDGVKNIAQGDKVAVRMLTSCGECYYCRSGHENQCVKSFVAQTHEGVQGAGGLAEYVIAKATSVYKFPADSNLEEIALTEPLACCVHSVTNAQINLADDVVVVGCGIMGAFHVALAKLRGSRVIVCEVDEARLKVAKSLGADICVNTKSLDAVEKIKELTEGRGADVVFCTAALSKLAEDAVKMAGKLGRVIFYSSFHPAGNIEIDPNKIHSGEQIITGSVNPNRRDFLISSRLIAQKAFDISLLISERYNFCEIDKAFERAASPETYRVLVKY